jgi:hypothetical protein
VYPQIKTKISAHRYTGKYLPHEHTSYFGLGFIILLCTIILASVTFSAAAYNYGDPNPGPWAGSIALTGTVKGPPPKEGATILSPSNGQTFSSTPITVSGTCPLGTLVEIFKNDIFAGATECTDKKTFSVDIDLLYGANALTAQDFDNLDQAGPPSNTVNVTYNALPPQTLPLSTTNLNNLQLLLNTSAIYRGVFPGQQFQLPIDIISGTPPFALSIDWGDGKIDLMSVPANLTANGVHVYKRAGVYQVNIKATDASGRQAFLTIVVIVNGKVQAISTSTSTPAPSIQNQLFLAWPLLVLVIAMAISYWLGEQREKHKLAVSGHL